ncbi:MULTISPECIES: hypothetical protein [Moorena]|uniref:Uncharacterized protein n=1 Tax=Moorena producens 3L TaxID=489825 RepID=F4Y1A5_9CYAN|nr:MULTISPECIES: hypothetical protein [Moorena]NEQ13858.1 hypothetical protein [Moorena sp. SIO3E2]EGJ29047.1 hypothetical protein LYNGBM3L_65600 [Moorena producens 3L]NEP30882.1 hypothetical protein [Moorena sp. SIO3B2]NEP67033.1 hypothetical protein [Moorena sp. SIO3A5]NEQ11088.1 hypothetical protein [Moorena sp. SIO4E2]
MRYKFLGFREQRIWEQGTEKRQEARGKRQEGKNLVYLIIQALRLNNENLVEARAIWIEVGTAST